MGRSSDHDSLGVEAKNLISRAQQVLFSDTALGFAAGSATTLAVAALYTRFYRRIPNSDSMPVRLMERRKWIKGVVTSVGDADNFRLYHTPGLFWRWPLKFRSVPTNAKELKDQTIHIRMAGIDAPEAAHFGKPAQPYAAEALAWLKSEIEGRRVWVQVYRRDQYARIVGMTAHTSIIPFRPFSASRCIPLRMMRAGWGEVYESAGAEYGRWGKEAFRKAMEDAKQHRRGMWASDTLLETVSEYKKRMKAGDVSTAASSAASRSGTNAKSTTASPHKGLWQRIVFWR